MRRIIFLLTLLGGVSVVNQALAALPFVTDDAAIANKDQLLIEAFAERWHLPKKGESESTNMLGQYLGLSYG